MNSKIKQGNKGKYLKFLIALAVVIICSFLLKENVQRLYKIAQTRQLNESEVITQANAGITSNTQSVGATRNLLSATSSSDSINLITYNGGIVAEFEKPDDLSNRYKGQYVLSIDPRQENIIIKIEVDEDSTITVDGNSEKSKMTIEKNVENMNIDMVIDVSVAAKNGTTSLYKVVIHKTAQLAGKIITDGSYSNININLYNDNDELLISEVNNDGKVAIEVEPGVKYKIEIKKDGYLKYTLTDFEPTYGTRNYFGELKLLAGEVIGNDEVVNLRDLVATNVKAKAQTAVDETNSNYDFNGDLVINEDDVKCLSTNYNMSEIVEPFVAVEEDIPAPEIVEFNADARPNDVLLTATVNDFKLDKVYFNINGTIIEGKIDFNKVTATYDYEMAFNEQAQLSVRATNKADKETISEEKTVTSNVIRTEDDIVLFSSLVNDKKTYEGENVYLAANLDLTDKEFAPIGKSNIVAFKGTFDGYGHIVSNINVNSSLTCVGLFGATNGATIKNVGVRSGSFISTKSNIGGIVGYARNTTIDSCFVSATVQGTESIGGIVGYSVSSTVTNCYSTGSVSGEAKVGGIVGYHSGESYERNNYSISNVTGSTDAGRIVGSVNINRGGKVENCYYSGEEESTVRGIGTLLIDGDNNFITEEVTDKDELLAKLGSTFKKDFLRPINNKYPILKWQQKANPEMITVLIDANEGEYEGETLIDQKADTTLELSIPVREDCDFKGWEIVEGDGEVTETVETPETRGETEEVTKYVFTFKKEDTIIKAKWELTQYEITYNLDEGEIKGEEQNPETYTIDTEDFTLINPEKKGYMFVGWTGTDLEEATKDVTITKGSRGNREYTAVWEEAKFYIISYNLDGGVIKGEEQNPETYTIDTEDFTLINPKKKGYIFMGWTGTELDEATDEVTIEKGSTGNRLYSATWKEVNKTVYAKLYKDGTLAFTATDKLLTGKTSSDVTLSRDITGGNYTSASNVPWYSYTSSVKKVIFVDEIYPDTVNNWFNGCVLLTEVENIEKLHTFNMSNLFYNCYRLETLDLSNFDTTFLAGMGSTFYGCKALTSLDLSNFDTSDITSLYYTFNGCESLTELNLSSFGPAKLKNLFCTFNGCKSLTNLDLSSFNTENVTSMGNMFADCSSLETLDLSNFNTEEVTNMYRMFTGCTSLKSVNLSSFDTSSVTDMGQMFCECSKLIRLDLTSFNTSKVTNFGSMFSKCTIMDVIYGKMGLWDTSKGTVSSMFNNCGTDHVTLIGENESILYINEDGGTYDGSLTIIRETGTEIELSIPTKKRCTFKGWTVKYGDGAISENTYTFGEKSTEIIANWENVPVEEYTITYELNDGIVDGENPTTYTNYSEEITLINPTKEGYTFDGWTGTDLEGATKNVVIKDGSTGNREYTANWTVNEYEVTYEYNGASEVGDQRKTVVYKSPYGELFTPKKEIVVSYDTDGVIEIEDSIINYSFSGWFKDEEYSQESNVTAETIVTTASNHTIYAKWEALETSVRLPEVEKEDSILLGWYTKDDEKVGDAGELYTPTTTITLYAKWEEINQGPKEYTITYNLDGGALKEGKENPETYRDDSENIRLENPTKSGYDFAGWTGSNGEEPSRKVIIETGSKGNKTYTANWIEVSSDIYVKLYDGNTLVFTSSDKTISGKTLTEDYGNIEGETYTSYSARAWNSDASAITTVIFEDVIHPTIMSYWFCKCTALTSIEKIENLDTSAVTKINSVFAYCSSLSEIDLHLFETSNFQDTQSMFLYCSEITELDFSNFDTSNVTNMNTMFGYCTGLTQLDITNFDTSKVTNLMQMFLGCTNLQVLDLRNFNTSSCTSMKTMFRNCSSLTEVKAGPKWDVSKVTTRQNMFDGAGVDEVTVYGSDNIYAKIYSDGLLAFTSTNRIIYPELTYSGSTESNKLTSGCEYDMSGKSYTSTSKIPYYSVKTTIKKVIIVDKIKPASTAYWFHGLTNTTAIEKLENMDTSAVTTMKYMFYNCNKLTELNGLTFDTSNVTDMLSMFNACSGLTTLDLTSFDTHNVTSFNSMFYNCSKLTLITGTVGLWDETNGTKSNTFTGCGTTYVTLVESGTKLNIDANGGTYDGEDTIRKPSGTTIQLSTPTKDGYTFDKWTLESGDGVISGNNFTFGDEESTILANWNIEKYTITYNLNGGTEKYANPVEYTAESDEINISIPVKQGYGFAGWTGTDLDGTTRKVTIPTGSSGNKSYTANWEEIPTDVYVKLYSDGTLAFTRTDKLLDGKISSDVSVSQNISETEFDDYSSNPWYTKRTAVKKVIFEDVIYPTSTAYWFYLNNSLTTIEKIENLDTSQVTNMKYMFYKCNALPELDVSYFNTSNVTDMSYMFAGDYLNYLRFTKLDVSKFDTSNVTNMSNMFNYCYNVTELDVSNFNTSKVTDMSYMFYDCKSTTKLDVSKFNTSNVTNMSNMFYYCTAVEKLDVSKFNTENVTDMSYMFSGYNKETPPDVSKFNTSNVTTMQNMFSYCKNITEIDVSNFDTSNVTTMNSMFIGSSALKRLDLRSFNTSNVTNTYSMFESTSSMQIILGGANWDMSKVTNSTYMFKNSGVSKVTIYLGEDIYATVYNDGILAFTSDGRIIDGENQSNVLLATNITGMTFTTTTNPWHDIASLITTVDIVDEIVPDNTTYWFLDCVNLTQINNLEKINSNSLTSIAGIFRGCSGLTSIDLSGFDTSYVTKMSEMFSGCSGLTSINLGNFDTTNVTGMNEMFKGCSGLTSINLSSFNTSKVTSMASMFNGCTGLTSLNLSNFETPQMLYFTSMFEGCTGLTELDISGFVTNKVYNFSNMFKDCNALASLNVSGFNTEKATNMSYMFSGCKLITGLNLSGFNTSNVTNMSYMFNLCTGLTSIDVSGFNTAKVTTMTYMFKSCTKLTTINVSSFNTSAVTDMSYMFANCTKLKTLDLSSFNTSNVTTMKNMFFGCMALTSVNVSSFNTAKVTTMYSMFDTCASLTTLNLRSFSTASLTTAKYMFLDCQALSSVYVSSSWSSTYNGTTLFAGGCKITSVTWS